jgi:hypothetical protein
VLSADEIHGRSAARPAIRRQGRRPLARYLSADEQGAIPRTSLSDAEIDALQRAISRADELAHPPISIPPPSEDSPEKSTRICRETLAIWGGNGENGEWGSKMRETHL